MILSSVASDRRPFFTVFSIIFAHDCRVRFNNKEIYAKKTIAESFNNYFINVGPNVASNIDTSMYRTI